MTKNSPEQLLKSLIEIDSSSGKEETALLYIEALLQKSCFVTERIPVTETTFCLLAMTGNPRVILQAHIDTVLPYIPFSEDDTRIFGRGSCDTKGSVAAMIAAATSAEERGLTNFGLLFTVEEETSFAGAKAAAQFFGQEKPFFVVGEPSSLTPITSHFGIETFTITAVGKAAHTSMPENGVNAIELLLTAAEKLSQLKLGTGTLATIAQITGGIAPNIVPASAQLVFSMRIAPDDNTNYEREISKLVVPCQVTRGEFLPPVQGSVPKNLSFLGEGQTVRYCTELAFLQNGCILGPGDITFAHAADEQVSKAELAQATQLYERIIEAFQVTGKV